MPMTVPLTCRKCRELKEKLLWVRIFKFCELEEESSGWLGVGRRWSRKCSRTERPWVLGMLVYRDETSTVTMMVSGGKGWVGIG